MSLEQIRGFLEASGEIEFVGKNRKEVYNWVGQTLVGQQYHILLKEEKGLLRIYLAKMTGLSRAQLTRLIGQYLDTGTIEGKGTTGAASRACTPELTLVYWQKWTKPTRR